MRPMKMERSISTAAAITKYPAERNTGSTRSTIFSTREKASIVHV